MNAALAEGERLNAAAAVSHARGTSRGGPVRGTSGTTRCRSGRTTTAGRPRRGATSRHKRTRSERTITGSLSAGLARAIEISTTPHRPALTVVATECLFWVQNDRNGSPRRTDWLACYFVGQGGATFCKKLTG